MKPGTMKIFRYIVAVGMVNIILILAFRPCRTLTDELHFLSQGYTIPYNCSQTGEATFKQIVIWFRYYKVFVGY